MVQLAGFAVKLPIEQENRGFLGNQAMPETKFTSVGRGPIDN